MYNYVELSDGISMNLLTFHLYRVKITCILQVLEVTFDLYILAVCLLRLSSVLDFRFFLYRKRSCDLSWL